MGGGEGVGCACDVDGVDEAFELAGEAIFERRDEACGVDYCCGVGFFNSSFNVGDAEDIALKVGDIGSGLLWRIEVEYHDSPISMLFLQGVND